LAHFRFFSRKSLVLQIVKQANGASFVLVHGNRNFLASPGLTDIFRAAVTLLLCVLRNV
jgi:hypothetical protein